MNAPQNGWRSLPLKSLVSTTVKREIPSRTSSRPYWGLEHVESGTGRLLGSGRASDIQSSSPRVTGGEVLYGRLRPYLNKVITARSEAYVSSEFIVLRPNDGVDADFLRWRLSAEDFVRFATKLNSGDRPRVKWPQMSDFAVVLPPLVEQRRIVEVLEELLSRLDEARRLLTSAHAHTGEYAAVMREHLVWSSASRTTLVGDILAQPMRNGHSAPSSPTGQGVRTLTLSAVTRGDFGSHNTKFTTADESRVHDLWLRSGDVLVERSNTAELVGTSALYEGPSDWAIYPDLLIRLRSDESRMMSSYLALALGSERVRRYFRSHAKGLSGSMPKIDQTVIAAAEVPLPDLVSQQALVRFAADGRDAARNLQRELDAADRRQAVLRMAVLSAAFSGHLTGDASDLERAEELVS